MKTQSVDEKLLKTIRGHGVGWVFTPAHLSHLGSRDAIASALKRHVRAGTVRRLSRGLYDYPRLDPQLGLLEPSSEAVARALAGRDAIRLQPTGALAANMLGLTTQVPARIVYLTDGRSREVVIGNRTITLRRTTPRNMATAGRTSGLVIQALRHIGKDAVDNAVIDTIDRQLTDADRRTLQKDARYAPDWIRQIMRGLIGTVEEP